MNTSKCTCYAMMVTCFGALENWNDTKKWSRIRVFLCTLSQKLICTVWYVFMSSLGKTLLYCKHICERNSGTHKSIDISIWYYLSLLFKVFSYGPSTSLHQTHVYHVSTQSSCSCYSSLCEYFAGWYFWCVVYGSLYSNRCLK